MAKKPITLKTVETLVHDEAKRKNIPTAEHQSVVKQDYKKPVRIKYPRNTDLDPQLVWRGKDEKDWSDLVVNAPPLYIQEKVHPKALIDDLLRLTKEDQHESVFSTADLFADFDGIPRAVDKTEFYSHKQNWSNRMILGDSLQVMASLAEREGLRGQVQCIYFDPPYGIKFNSNFQWSTTSKDVRDGNRDHITREPEMVKAFRDTWRDGINSYLTYIRDRLTVARDLLTESGSLFLQIGDENVHLLRSLLDEVFGDTNLVSQISFQKSGGFAGNHLVGVQDYILWYCKDISKLKYRSLYTDKSDNAKLIQHYKFDDGDGRLYRLSPINSQDVSPTRTVTIEYQGKKYHPGANRHWSIDPKKIPLLLDLGILTIGGTSIYRKLYLSDQPGLSITNNWDDTARGSFHEKSVYVVQTTIKTIQRCILLATDPGDLVLDPTCGSGTTAYVSEQWGRRWITMDTSRVALALARARVMGAKFPFYALKDSREGQLKEAELYGRAPSSLSTTNNINYGFLYERVPNISMKSIANNIELDEIVDKWRGLIDEKITEFEKTSGLTFDLKNLNSYLTNEKSQKIIEIVSSLRQMFEKRKVEVDIAIKKNAEYEFLYDKPIEIDKKVRVAGPFTVDSLSPHRAADLDENDNLIEKFADEDEIPKQTFTQMILDNLKISGVQQAHKENKITFSSLVQWPGNLVCAEGRYFERETDSKEERRAAIFIGPEFGTVQRADLVQAAREAGDAGFDSLIACAFNYEAHASELNKLGSIPILKARMNADLHMSEDLKNTGKGNLFVIFGEPDIDVIQQKDELIRVKVNGVDVFKPQTGEVVSDGADGIACWFIDTDYNEESFFVRHAYFLGANDPYSSLKTTLKAEINFDAWATLNSDMSRAFPKPKSGRIAVKVINHLGDEVMKVFKV
jgi:adenine-specific DNA-methyltransferase